MDPITQVNYALWDWLLAFGPFRDAIQIGGTDRPGNWLSTVTRDGFARATAVGVKVDPASKPWILVTQTGFRPRRKGRNSQVVSARQAFTLEVASGAADAERLNLIKTEAFFALSAAPPDLGLSPLVADWEFLDGEEGPGVNPRTQDVSDQWHAVLPLEVELYWRRDQIAALGAQYLPAAG
jgi:hypothetical protein